MIGEKLEREGLRMIITVLNQWIEQESFDIEVSVDLTAGALKEQLAPICYPDGSGANRNYLVEGRTLEQSWFVLPEGLTLASGGLTDGSMIRLKAIYGTSVAELPEESRRSLFQNE